MKKSQNLNYWALIATVLLILFGSSIAQPQIQSLTVQPTQEPIQQQPTAKRNRMDRSLKLSVTVDDQSFLRVKETVITDRQSTPSILKPD